MKTISLILLTLVCQLTFAWAEIVADRTATLEGRVTDAVNGQPVIGANIYFPELKQGVVTNADGHYRISRLPVIKTTVQVSYVGHQTIVRVVDLRSQATLDFVLRESNAMLSEVMVTGLTGQLLAELSPSPVSVVSSRMLQETMSQNIIDAIAHQPGVAQITTGSGISKPVIRGLGYNRVVVVNEGVRQEGQQWGDEHGIEVDAQGVRSAEILKGPASLMYGSDALAGVLVLHGAPIMPLGQRRLTLGTEYQTNNHLFAYTANFAGNERNVVWNWRWSEKDAGQYKNAVDGRVPGSQLHERALSGMVGLNRGWGYSHLKLSLYRLTPGLIEGERDENTGILEPSEAYQKVHHYKAVLDNSFLLGEGSLKALVGYQQNRRREYESPEELGLDFRLHTVNYNLHYLLSADESWRYAVGVSGMYQYSENLGEEYLIPSYRLFDVGAFASATRMFDYLTFSGGLRYDLRRLHSYSLVDDGEERFSDFTRNFRGLTASLGLIWHVGHRLNVRLNASHGFRAPNLSELGANGEHEGTFRYELGNQSLHAEHSWQADFGIDYSSEVVSAQLMLFANHIANYIFLEKQSQTDNLYQYQSGTARICGGEAVLDIHPVEPLHFESTFSYVNARQLYQPSDNRWLPFTPAPRWTSDLRYDLIRDGRVFNNTYLSIGLECYLRQTHVRTAYAMETPTPSYTLLNLSAGTDLRCRGSKVASLFVTVSNLTDRAYQSHLSRLKYADGPGICNMGRSVGVKLLVPITF